MSNSRRCWQRPRRRISATNSVRCAKAGQWLRKLRRGSSRRRPAEVAMLRRHDLIQVEHAAWDGMLRRHPALLDLPLVADWARLGRPVIVRRRMVGDCVDGVPAALPLPPCHGKRRLAFSFPAAAAMVAVPPVLLCDAARTTPTAWQSAVNAARVRRSALGARYRAPLSDREVGSGPALVD